MLRRFRDLRFLFTPDIFMMSFSVLRLFGFLILIATMAL